MESKRNEKYEYIKDGKRMLIAVLFIIAKAGKTSVSTNRKRTIIHTTEEQTADTHDMYEFKNTSRVSSQRQRIHKYIGHTQFSYIRCKSR